MKKRYVLIIVWALMVLGNFKGIDFCLSAKAETETVLYVSGGTLTDEISRYFVDEGVEVEVDVDCAYLDASGAQRVILAGMDTPDVFVLDLNDGYWGLVQKGYLEAVEDPVLTDAVTLLYPAVRRGLTDQNGQVVAVPEFFAPIHWCVNETFWQRVFGDTPYPETFLEFAVLFSLWKEELAENYPEYKMLEFSGDSRALMLDVIKQVVAQCESARQPVAFDDPVMIRTLDALRDLDLQSVTEGMEDAYFNQQPLLMMRPAGGFGVEYLDGCRYVPILPPRLTRESPAYVPVRMRVMVHQSAQQKQTAGLCVCQAALGRAKRTGESRHGAGLGNACVFPVGHGGAARNRAGNRAHRGRTFRRGPIGGL